MLEIIPIDTPSLGDRSYLAHDGEVALVVDPQRDLDRVLALAEQHGVRITHVFETHIHNDHVSGGLALAKATDAADHVNADDPGQLGDVPAGQVWVVCRSGYRATVAASLLAAHGRDAPSGQGAHATPHDAIPAWRRVLAVVAHPDDESFGLGGLLDAFHNAGAETTVLCLTQGEASTLRGVPGDLHEVRAAELRDAAALLGVAHVEQRDHPDGHLAAVPTEVLAGEVAAAARAGRGDGLLVFDTNGVTGHPDHTAATAAALHAARSLDLPVLGWTIPISVAEALNAEFGTRFTGRQPSEIHLAVRVDRTRQGRAAHVHPSQALPTSALWRRLELLGDAERLRWLRNPVSAAPPDEELGQS
jgi:LmbE family N-acetylglucosaminyl deacetylase